MGLLQKAPWPVVSMGGLTIVPSRTLAEVEIDDVAAFLLPGGDRW